MEDGHSAFVFEFSLRFAPCAVCYGGQSQPVGMADTVLSIRGVNVTLVAYRRKTLSLIDFGEKEMILARLHFLKKSLARGGIVYYSISFTFFRRFFRRGRSSIG